jgi:hypothetical protein
VSRRATLRASDNDRELVAERLRSAAAEGRIVAEELEERLALALRARTYGELDALIADLPRPREQVARRGGRVSRSGAGSLWRLGPVPTLALLVFAMPIAVAAVVAVMTIVFALFTMWAVFAALIWLALGHSRRWYGPRWSYARRHFGPPRSPGVYRPRPGYWH